MHPLALLLKDHEGWLMRRVRDYAIERDYTRYTSTLEEAWRVSIVGLSDSISAALELSSEPWELGPDDDFVHDPVAAFGVQEAQKHRTRGITLEMFLGLMKYYRQSYLDLVADQEIEPAVIRKYLRFIERVFDRIEIAFCAEWSRNDLTSTAVHQLQEANRRITNEKNQFLTIFESLPIAVFLLNNRLRVNQMNQAASKLLLSKGRAGSYYYSGRAADAPFPWFGHEVGEFLAADEHERNFFATLTVDGGEHRYRVSLRWMQDISKKFTGMIVSMNDITEQWRLEQKQSAGGSRE